MGENISSQQTQDLSEILQIRRDKLSELQAAGKDPFLITKYDATPHVGHKGQL